MKSKSDILGLGYCSWDTLCLLPHIPLDDKVQIVQSIEQGGGPAATAIAAAARLGAKTTFIGAIGDDRNGENILSDFATEGVSTEWLVKRTETSSATAYCWVDQSTGKRSIAWTHGGAAPLTPDEVSEEAILSARALHLDGHQTPAAIRAAEIARAHDIPVFLDAGTLVNDIERLLSLCTVVIASEVFAERFTGEKDPQAAARALHRLGPEWTGVTLGRNGSIGFDGKRIHEIPTPDVKVVDTTGAGDVFHGAFAARYVDTMASGPDLADCLHFASAVAAMKCRKLGGRTGIPTREEALAFIKSATAPSL
ncbi:PfkB family carbohydrate kinase [Ruficoccus sp. ZRK36]|uniref:carbohydrate kinase family protein n=1 Tax=Ruficoccus sp. ZRK36 TaxID=2866311 RepID=UPI001C73A1B2|nr:PfkB family carbohydrate kinase [Ruficoccus sp. ZRK36]QYY34336.1 hypothetical protein K0V07_08390 [Ruficoccus sp. ZRK36]